MKKWKCCSWRSGDKPFTFVGGQLYTSAGRVGIRRPRWADGEAIQEARFRSEESVRAYEPDNDAQDIWDAAHAKRNWRFAYQWMINASQAGYLAPFVIVVDGAVVGQVQLSHIEMGALKSATLGYWVDDRYAGRGVATAAAALAVDYGFDSLNLHRVQATVHPTNLGSRRVLEHIGMRQEGVLQRYLKVHGVYEDHELWAVTREDLPRGAVIPLLGKRVFRFARDVRS